ncbi:MAG: hypothetical protein IN808_08140, partial [Rubrobacter sp.]|nr:hypothetical protein [Rubrobacter sp.]
MIRTGEKRPAAGRKASVLGLLLAAITLMLGYAAGANAAPGDLDTTFSSDGRLTTDFGSVTDRVNDVAIQDNGKVVAAGITQSVNGDGTIDFALARYNPNGSLDATFGSGGRVVTSFGAGDDHAYAIAIQGDGKIVVAGSSGGDFALARYRANGNPDTTFSGDGRLTTDFGSASDVAYGLALQADGRIVAAGQTSQSDFALARYNPDGTLDETFDGAGGNGNGKVTTELGSSEGVKDVAIQQDGRIVVAGYTVDYAQGTDYNFALARYDSSGALDATFSGDGVLTTDFGDHEFFDHDEAEALAVKEDGSIFAAGWSEGQASSTFALARYDENGNLVGSFGAGGKVLTGFEDDPQSLPGAAAFDLKVQPGGKLVAAGDSKGDFALARYSPSGALDATFSGDGRLTTDFGKGDDYAYAL